MLQMILQMIFLFADDIKGIGSDVDALNLKHFILHSMFFTDLLHYLLAMFNSKPNLKTAHPF